LPAEVLRTRLVSALTARFDRPVTSIVAGAGFGKTTLLAQAMRQNLAEPLGIDGWVSCQPDDQDPDCFVAACCRAAGTEPDVSGGRSADVVAAMRDMSPIDVCLVIDDVHELIGSQSEALLADVTRRLPGNGHLVLSGRAPIDVPLARLRASGRCLELDQLQLAFTATEERELAGLLEVAPPCSGLAGWPALTRLALTARPAAPYEFLWEEVVGGLPPDLLQALLALALVGWGDGRMISAICGRPIDIAAFAGRVPLVSLSDGDIVRAHDLWTESLDRLYSTTQIRDLLPGVSAVLQSRHDFLRLADVAARYGDPSTRRVAARELVRHTVASLPVRRAHALLAAAADDRGRPEMQLLQAALAHAVAVDDPKIDALVTEATAAFAASSDHQGETAALLLAGQIANSRGAYTQFLGIASRVVELPGAQQDLTLHAVAQLVAATLAEMNGDLGRALDALATLPPLEMNYPLREAACRLQVYLLVLAGRADEAVPIADAVLCHSSNAHVRRTPPFVRWSAGDTADLDTLCRTVEPPPDINARDRFFHAALATHVHASTGDADKLQALADQLESMPLNRADVRDASMLAAAAAVRLVARHEENRAAQLLADHLVRHPVSDPRCDIHLRRALATVYVCAPSVRPVWDSARLGRCHRRMLAVAHAVVAVRQTGAASTLPLDDAADAISRALKDTDALLTMIPLSFTVELAARAHGLGLPAGARALDLLRHRLGDRVVAELRWQHVHGDEAVRPSIEELLDTRRGEDATTVRIEVLGPTQVLVDGRPVENASARRVRVRQLLALLVVEPRIRRERAMALLWPELDQTAASRNLRVTLTYLRQLFRQLRRGRSVAGAPLDERFVLVDSSSIHLVTYAGLEVDLWQLDANLAIAARARAAGDLPTHSRALSAIVALWHGEPLIDLVRLDELTGEVTRVRTALIDSTLALGEIRLTEGRAAESVRHAQAVLAADPFIERAHRLAIAAQIHLGDYRAARDAAARLDEALAEVKAVPTDGTKILLRRIAAISPTPA
jgi:DNA-binding SARP family transcriptional activator